LMHSMRACGWRVAMRRACTKRMHWNQFQTGAARALRATQQLPLRARGVG
jgi:hypothetical protein